MLSTNHMQGESMSFEELNVPKNHIYLFKPQVYQIPVAVSKCGRSIAGNIWYNVRVIFLVQ